MAATEFDRLVAQLERAGWTFVRHGRNHQIWRCPCGKHTTIVGRHGRDACRRNHANSISRIRACPGRPPTQEASAA